MLRFANTVHLDAWRQSETWRHLLEEVQSLLAEKSSIEN
jgi:antibiotic biosynthesis monooxygenase (ABM) superfamily enzyme